MKDAAPAPWLVAINPDVYTLHAAAAACAMQHRACFQVYDGALNLLCTARWEWTHARVVFDIGTPVDGDLSAAATVIYRAACRIVRGKDHG